jgi:hypothetical protein
MTCLGRFDRRGAGNCRACTLEQSVVEQEMGATFARRKQISNWPLNFWVSIEFAVKDAAPSFFWRSDPTKRYL